MAIKKLIEVALPLEAINEGCAKEKNPFLKHHPRSMHLWWARRPLASNRAIIFAQLVDDPSSNPEEFPTIEQQDLERKRLFKIIEDITKWENLNNEAVLNLARREIKKSWERTCVRNKYKDNTIYSVNELPELHDPFAGGGGIPLEAQRLGISVVASDLNPVAVMINKALLEFPANFYDTQAVHPKSNLLEGNYNGTEGLKDDIRYYGKLLLKVANEKLDGNYPKVKYEDGKFYDAIAWIWARSVKCPNPACSERMPLASTFVLSKKRGREAWVEPISEGKYKLHLGVCPTDKASNKMGRGAVFKCPFCGSVTTDEYVKQEARAGKMGYELMAIVIDTENGKQYVEPDDLHISKANVSLPYGYPVGEMPDNPRWFSPPAFGMDSFYKLFTNRQLTTLCTLSESLPLIYDRIIADGGSPEYAKAILVYLSFGISQLSRYSCTICGWNNTNENVAQAFGRQAIPMVWDFAEANPLVGPLEYLKVLEWPVNSIQSFKCRGTALQAEAQNQKLSLNRVVSTDPPYYDNIGYADLSDFFYIWLRKCLLGYYPDLFSTILVPKMEELVATPYRHGGKEKAEEFFMEGMTDAMNCIKELSLIDYPITIYYAFKQSEKTESIHTNKGWATFLEAVISAGLQITGTWPMNTERTKGLKSNVNALASSIVLVCRKKDDTSPIVAKKTFISNLRKELKTSLIYMQTSNIAPVDMAQSAIGPGMAVFSRYSQVLEADGTPMSVRSALAIINEELDAYFNEQVGSMDSASRFCVDLYTQLGYNQIKYGEAEVLANAKGISIPALEKRGILYAKAGVLHLYERGELPTDVDAQESNIWLLTQQLTHIMSKDGIMGCAKAIVDMVGTNIENARDLAYRLYDLAEKKKWSEEAYAYNSLVVAWPDIQSAAAEMRRSRPQQQSLF